MTHCDEESLLQYAEGTSPVGSEIASHLAGCASCSDTMEEQRELIGMLREAEVWEGFPDSPAVIPAGIRDLSDVQSRIAAEDADAAQLLDEALKGPAAWWTTRLMQSQRHLTAGVVRQLLVRAEGLEATAPQQAADMTKLAVDISSELPLSEYPSDLVITLRGHARREHAYSLMWLGRYHDALRLADEAESTFAQLPIPEYERARVQLVRAMIVRNLDRFEEAAVLARASAMTFGEYGDVRRYTIARMIQSAILQQTGRLQEALAGWVELAAMPSLDPATRVAIKVDTGICYRGLGQIDKAAEHITAAAAEYDMLGETIFAAKARWSLAATLVAAARPADAVPILRTTWKQFENLGMEADAALVGLELAEALLLSDQADDVPAICRSVLDRFTRAGMTSRAINALAFLREAIALGQAEPTLVRHVHDFLRKLPAESSRVTSSKATRLED
jgi:tetratricopeptide (TPR) repeat protein